MENNHLPFRPLDNSSTTRMGYNLEANHWLRSLNGAQATATDFSMSLGLIGALFTILISLIFIVLILVTKILVAILSIFHVPNEEPKKEDPSVVEMTEEDEKFFHKW